MSIQHAIGNIFGTTAVIVLAALLRTWVMVKVWAWLAVPLFSVPSITVIQALAVSVMLMFLPTGSSKKDDRPYWTVMGEGIAKCIVHNLGILLCAWVVSLFI